MRAESRGLAGRSAMLSAGRSKSNRSVRMLYRFTCRRFERAANSVSMKSGAASRVRSAGDAAFDHQDIEHNQQGQIKAPEIDFIHDRERLLIGSMIGSGSYHRPVVNQGIGGWNEGSFCRLRARNLHPMVSHRAPGETATGAIAMTMGWSLSVSSSELTSVSAWTGSTPVVGS